VVALVRGLHGLNGSVRVEVLTDRPAGRFAVGRRLYREGAAMPLTIVAAAPDGPGWRLRFAEVADRTAAETLRDTYLESVVEPGEELARGEHYWHEVIGATVRGLDGAELGTVVDVYRVGVAEVYVVRGARYGEFDVPGVRDIVRILAPARGEIVIDADALDLQPARVRPIRPPRPRRTPRKGGRAPSSAPPEAGTPPETSTPDPPEEP
jgi:16S rRNA processing protein RimM